MCANQIAEEEGVVETKLTDLDTDAGCDAVIPIADARTAKGLLIWYSAPRWVCPPITLLPLVGED